MVHARLRAGQGGVGRSDLSRGPTGFITPTLSQKGLKPGTYRGVFRFLQMKTKHKSRQANK